MLPVEVVIRHRKDRFFAAIRVNNLERAGFAAVMRMRKQHVDGRRAVKLEVGLFFMTHTVWRNAKRQVQRNLLPQRMLGRFIIK